MQEKLNKIDYKSWIIIVLLLIILGLQVCHNTKMWKFFAKFERAGIMMKQDMKRDSYRFRKDIARDTEVIKKEFEDRKTRPVKSNIYSFYSKENYDQKAKRYVIELGVPENIEEKDIKIELKNNILVVSLTKNDEVKDGSTEVKNYINFSRFFSIPKTSAAIKDIKHTLKDGVLTIIVPII